MTDFQKSVNANLVKLFLHEPLVQDFGKLFAVVAGHPQTIRATRSRISGFPHRMRLRVRELLPSSE